MEGCFMEPLIKVENLHKIYNPGENEVRALDGIDLEIGKGEFVAIIAVSYTHLTMIVFAFFDDNRLNQALAALKKSGAGPLPYKAVLTPTNQFWTAHECLAELKREHEAMTP